MRKILRLSSLSTVALTYFTLTLVQAQTPIPQDVGGSDACMQAVDYPKPFGEWDLKGNAKLRAYCGCLTPKFRVRAEEAMKYMQANPGKAPPGTLEQSVAEELELRNSCRKQLGLPLAVDFSK